MLTRGCIEFASSGSQDCIPEALRPLVSFPFCAFGECLELWISRFGKIFQRLGKTVYSTCVFKLIKG